MQDDLVRLAAFAGLLSAMVIYIAAGGALQRAESSLAGGTQSAAVFFVPSITLAKINSDYQKQVRILIVPGHQPDTGGTEYNGVYERDVVVDIASALADLLARNPHYDVMVARGKTAWNPVLQSYFDTHTADITAFLASQKLQMAQHIADGRLLVEPNQVYHNTTPLPAALQLYGINKWTSENNIGITLHLHINDYARRTRAGKYDGFAVYVPDRQYSNAEVSKAIGTAIAARLSPYHATSTLPKEEAGVAKDQELIAI